MVDFKTSLSILVGWSTTFLHAGDLFVDEMATLLQRHPSEMTDRTLTFHLGLSELQSAMWAAGHL